MSTVSTTSFTADGLSVGVVKYPDGVFRQVAPGRRWVEDAYNWQPAKGTFQYVETARSKAAVLLYDASRTMNILLDLHGKRVALMAGRRVRDFGAAAAKFSGVHRITDATVISDQSMFQITGLTAGVIAHDSGVFRRTGSGEFWVEHDRRAKIIASFREMARNVDAITLQEEKGSSTIVFDFAARCIRSYTKSTDIKNVRKFSKLAIAEPLGVILKSIVVVSEGDFGDDEELYGRLHAMVVGTNVSSYNSEERELYNETKPVGIKEGESHELTNAKALFYGLDREDIIYIGGWLKEKDTLGDDELGFNQTAVPIAALTDEETVVKFEKGDTKVEVHFNVASNYYSHISRQDGFIPIVTASGLRNEPRFPGVVPMPHCKATSIADGFNVLPEGPESISNRLRSVVVVGIGFVPHVGGLLGEVVDMLWPEGEMEVWDEIKGRAEALMKNLITKERVHDLEKRLKGLKQTIDDYQNTSLGSSEKSSWMVNVISSLNAVQPFFFDERNPEYMLPYLVALGTLTLAVMREQVMFYNDIHGREDPDSDYKLKEMKERFEEYHGAVEKAVQGATQWRRNLVFIKKDDDENVVAGQYVVVDELSGYVSKQYRRRPETLYQNISQSVKNSFELRIEDMAQPASAWKYMLPQTRGLKFTRSLAKATSGPFPVEGWSAVSYNSDVKRISRIVISLDEYVRGMQVWYDGKPGPTFGDLTRGEQKRLDLDEDEVIIAASGRSEEVIDAMWMFTSKGRSVGGGQISEEEAFEWTAAPPSPDGYLEGIFGTSGGFGFNWRYYRIE